MNLNDNGPDDGGLMVIKGSSRLIEQYFDEKGRPPLRGSGKVSYVLLVRSTQGIPRLTRLFSKSIGTLSTRARCNGFTIEVVA